MEERVARLEGAFEQRNDVLLAIERRLDRLEQSIDVRFGQIDVRFGQIDGRFGQIDGRFAQIDQKFMWLTGIVVGTWITTILTILFHR